MSGLNLLYSDFNCSFCYAMHERLYEMNVLDRCEWRGVQHAPHLSTPMARWNGSLAAELRHEVTLVQRLAPGLAISLPPGKPNTRRAIELAASLLNQNAGRGMEFVRQAYRAFWCHGQDISDPVVLSRLAEGLGEGEVGEENRSLAQEWDAAWHATGQAGVPLLVSPEGEPLAGYVPVEEIRRFMQAHETRSPPVNHES